MTKKMFVFGQAHFLEATGDKTAHFPLLSAHPAVRHSCLQLPSMVAGFQFFFFFLVYVHNESTLLTGIIISYVN